MAIDTTNYKAKVRKETPGLLGKHWANGICHFTAGKAYRRCSFSWAGSKELVQIRNRMMIDDTRPLQCRVCTARAQNGPIRMTGRPLLGKSPKGQSTLVIAMTVKQSIMEKEAHSRVVSASKSKWEEEWERRHNKWHYDWLDNHREKVGAPRKLRKKVHISSSIKNWVISTDEKRQTSKGKAVWRSCRGDNSPINAVCTDNW